MFDAHAKYRSAGDRVLDGFVPLGIIEIEYFVFNALAPASLQNIESLNPVPSTPLAGSLGSIRPLHHDS